MNGDIQETQVKIDKARGFIYAMEKQIKMNPWDVQGKNELRIKDIKRAKKFIKKLKRQLRHADKTSGKHQITG